MQLTPAPDHLIVQIVEPPSESSRGIVMAQASVNEPPRGTAVIIGEYARDQLRTLEPGNTVYFVPGVAHPISRDGLQYAVIDHRSVLAWETSSQRELR